MNNENKQLLDEINSYNHDLALKSILKKLFSNIVKNTDEVESHTCLIVELSDTIKKVNPQKISNQITDCNNKIRTINEKLQETNDSLTNNQIFVDNQLKTHDKSISDLHYAHSTLINKNTYDNTRFRSDINHEITNIKNQINFRGSILEPLCSKSVDLSENKKSSFYKKL